MIRSARASDIDGEAFDLVFRSYERDAVTRITRERLRDIAGSVLQDGLAIVIEEGGRILGSAGLVRREWDESGETYLIDRWFVNVGGAHAFRELLWGCRRLARQAGLPLFLGVWLNDGVELKARLYTMSGGQLVGALVRFA